MLGSRVYTLIVSNKEREMMDLFRHLRIHTSNKKSKDALKKQSEETESLKEMGVLKFNPKKRKDSDKMSDKEKMDKGYNGSTYTINGIDNDF
tara:strand:+ start:322 stop:597 length:276 start_codon:yes stop_codon:yes gene_type:complete